MSERYTFTEDLIARNAVLRSEIEKLRDQNEELRTELTLLCNKAQQVVYGTEYLDHAKPWPALDELKDALARAPV